MSRLHGRRWQVRSFNTSSLRRSKDLAQRASYSSLVVHLRRKYSPSVQLENHLPPSEARWREPLFCDGDLWSAQWATLLHDLGRPRQLYRLTPLCESKCHIPAAQSSLRKDAVASEGLLDVQLCSQISRMWVEPCSEETIWAIFCASVTAWIAAPPFLIGPAELRPCLDYHPRGTAWKIQTVLSIYNRMVPAQIFTWLLTSSVLVVLWSRFDCSAARESSEKAVWPKQFDFCVSVDSRAVALSSHQNLNCLLRACFNTDSGVAGQAGLGSSLCSSWG